MYENHFEQMTSKKIERLEKWMERLQKELNYLKNVASMNNELKMMKMVQIELFKKSG